MTILLYAVTVLGIIGFIAAVILYFAAKRFHVEEDPRIAEIEELLPGANCGGCGLTGCHAFAEKAAKADSLEGFNCTGADDTVMTRIAGITGLTASQARKKKAVVRCSLSCDRRSPANHYDGPRSCAIENSLYQGESECIYSCLGCGDCVDACPFDAIHIDRQGDMPRVDLRKCVGCGKCVAACPRNIIDLADYDPGRPLVWVACSNHDRGPVAMKECNVACIGCGICVKKCPENAIGVNRFLASIDYEKCVGCLQCAEACPRHIIDSNARPALHTACNPGKQE